MVGELVTSARPAWAINDDSAFEGGCIIECRSRTYDTNGNHTRAWVHVNARGEIVATADDKSLLDDRPVLPITVIGTHKQIRALARMDFSKGP